jgi:hypothetical protein
MGTRDAKGYDARAPKGDESIGRPDMSVHTARATSAGLPAAVPAA